MSAAKPTRENALVHAARTVARLQRQISKRRREIKKLQQELRHERKILRALAYAGNRQQSAPSRVHGGATGYRVPDLATPRDTTTPVEDITEGFEDPEKES